MNTFLKKSLIASLSILTALGPTVSNGILAFNSAEAAFPTIRQEINIIDGYLSSASGAYATSSAIVSLDSTKYNAATYYFEVVASTTAATDATVSLVNRQTGTPLSSITVNGTSYTRYRSSSFTAPGSATDYVVVLGNEAVQKGIIAARIIIIQSTGIITTTETQIEIGNQETYTSTATSTFSSPKYWLYDSSKWDGSPTFYAEVSYMTIAGVASTTVYNTAGTYTVVSPAGTASTTIQLIGGGGSGGGATGNPDGGGGGAGGQFSQKTFVNYGNHTLVVAAAKTGTSGDGVAGNDSTLDTSVVIAKGGAGGTTVANDNAGAGSVTGGVGDVVRAGGNGVNGTTALGGAGGGGAGTTAAGSNGVTTTGGAGGASGGGKGGTGVTSAAAGGAGLTGGGGGSGALALSGTDRPGGNGGAGRATTTNYVATTSITLQEDNGSFASWVDKRVIVMNGSVGTSTRIRSAAFTPTTGRNYRIVFKNYRTNAVFAIYNAKIIVDQTNPTLLEAEYMIANTKFAAGTALQNFLTRWDPAEWASTTMTYKQEVDSVTSGTSDVKLQDTTGPTDVTGSTVTDVIEREQSGSMTMPGSATNIDTIATTNNNDLYSSVILAQTAIVATTSVPTSLGVVAGFGKVNLSWTAPTTIYNSAITYYNIYRTTGSPANVLFASTTQVNYEDHSGANGTTYFYRVTAVNAMGESGFSNEVSTAPTEGTASATRSNILLKNIRLLFNGGRINFR